MAKQVDHKENQKKLFTDIKNNFLDYDPVYFIQNNLTLDGEAFSLLGNGWKFMADVYRYVALQATKKTGKPVIIKKGRQVGATMMAGALDLYFTNSKMFSNPPIRVAHLFPSLPITKRFSQDKLENLIRSAKDDFINKNKLQDANAVDNQTMKQFNTGTLWIESIGADGDRIRGMTVDVSFYDECFPYKQNIEIENGKLPIGQLYRRFKKNIELPLVKTFNEEKEIFEYKKILNVWKKEKRKLIYLRLGQSKIRCTPEHKFLTNNGWEKACDLKIGSLIKSGFDYGKSNVALNEDQHQILLGSFLGDGSLQRQNKNRYALRIVHGPKQEKYCNWKASIFSSKVVEIAPKGYSKNKAYFTATKSIAIDKDIPKDKHTCPQWILDEIDFRGIAIWFMDDGSTSYKKTAKNPKPRIKISTCSFDIESHERFVKKFASLGIECKYRTDFRKGENFKKEEYSSLIFNSENSLKLLDLIRPYLHEDLYYKDRNSSKTTTKYEWNNSFKNYVYSVVDEIKMLDKEEVVYDIEVEDNHNFIACPSDTARRLGGPIVHNCQDMVSQAIGNSNKVLTAAKYGPVGKGVQVYFGTPKEKDSWFSNTWDMSDQRYYHLGCSACKNTFPFYQPNDSSWKDIWKTGYEITCPICKHVQHKIESIELGKWVATKKFEDCKFVGFHINQFYIPNLSREYINDLMPENNPNQSDMIWNNEVIGEFYSGVGMPLSRTHIELYCKDADRGFAKKIDPRMKKTYLGADWGDKTGAGSTGQSYSCVVVLSEGPDGTLLIEHAHKLKERSFDYKKNTITEAYKRFGIRNGVADFNFGQDVVRELQLGYGDRFLGAQGSGQLSGTPMRYREDELLLSYSKDLMIEELFSKIRKGKIRFPWKSYENVEWLIEHCTSMGTALRDKGGIPVKTYVKGSTPNDGLMALMYAYMAWKFDSTNKLTVKPGKPVESGMPKIGLAFVPRLRT